MPKTTKKRTYKANNRTETSKKGIINTIFPFEKGWKEMLKGESLSFMIGLIIFGISLFLFLSFSSWFITGPIDQSNIINGVDNVKYANYGGTAGAHIAYLFFNNLFGVSSYFIAVFILGLSMKLMKSHKIRLWKWFINCSFLTIWGSITLTLLSSPEFLDLFPKSWMQVAIARGWGGSHGYYIADKLVELIGLIGTSILLIIAILIYLIILWQETIDIIRAIWHPKQAINKKFGDISLLQKDKESTTDEEEIEEEIDSPTNEEETIPYQDDEETNRKIELSLDNEIILSSPSNVSDTIEENSTASTTTVLSPIQSQQIDDELEIACGQEEETAEKNIVANPLEELGPYDPRKDLEHYLFPTLSLLKKYQNQGSGIDMEEQKSNKDRIVNVLHDFGVEIVSIKATIGPTITLYEVTPAPGVRINKIRNLGDDIALSLSAIGIRIIAPIPGKGTIGIEVPNKNPKLVSMESILNSKKFQESEYELPIAIGKTITNEVFMVDLAKMPHVLVAGATGQGKSVGLNAIIASLLYKKHPAELKFVMVDPKKVEFSVYTPLEKHFLAKIPTNDDPIITDVNKVVQTLKSLCAVMDHRYDLLKKAHVRHIKEYNAKFTARKLNPNDGHEFMPYIVIIIDEFGDLIMTAGKEVELPIARIAQLARAVGMHMIIATQRPTTNIITGTIKANFPARMAFKVTSVVDSRTILDRPGANQLIGRGDLLFLAGNEPVRVQCAFLDTPEVEKINEHISSQQGYISAFELPEVAEETNDLDAGDSGINNFDSMFEEVARYIILNQAGSTSLIQRKFSIGYNRAGRLMDQMEAVGIVGPARGSKPREVLIQDESQVDMILNR